MPPTTSYFRAGRATPQSLCRNVPVTGKVS